MGSLEKLKCIENYGFTEVKHHVGGMVTVSLYKSNEVKAFIRSSDHDFDAVVGRMYNRMYDMVEMAVRGLV